MTTDPRAIVATYFDSWRAHDFATFRANLADDVVFDGPLGHVETAAGCTEAIERLAGMMTDLIITKVFVDGPDVLTWYDMHTAKTGPMPIANWCHVENGKIARIKVTFDPRPLLG